MVGAAPSQARPAAQQLAQLLPQLLVEQVDEIDSTNSELLRRVRSGGAQATLLRALRQTAGRGRQGRVWHSDAAALCCSLSWPSGRSNWDGLSLALGVTVAETLRAWVPTARLGLKWPNDLWVLRDAEDRSAPQATKLAGILIETAAATGTAGRWVIAGVGINITGPTGVVADGRGVPPVGLRECGHPDVDADAVWLALAPALWQAVQTFEVQGFEPFRPRFEALDLLRGHVVEFGAGDRDRAVGEAAGIDPAGQLLVHTCPRSGPPIAITSGDVSVRLAVPQQRS